jgi:hypothetical protein
MSNQPKTLEEQLGNDDWAIIIGSDGNLKGMFIPDGKDEEEVPESILYIMEKYFGIDFNEVDEEETSDGHTLH